MEAFSIGGIFALILLISGTILIVATVCRMIRGQIALPGWAKWLLSAAMILMLLITLLGMLPPTEVNVDNPFIQEGTVPVSPADPSEIATTD